MSACFRDLRQAMKPGFCVVLPVLKPPTTDSLFLASKQPLISKWPHIIARVVLVCFGTESGLESSVNQAETTIMLIADKSRTVISGFGMGLSGRD